jgi:hypothetical protein
VERKEDIIKGAIGAAETRIVKLKKGRKPSIEKETYICQPSGGVKGGGEAVAGQEYPENQEEQEKQGEVGACMDVPEDARQAQGSIGKAASRGPSASAEQSAEERGVGV